MTKKLNKETTDKNDFLKRLETGDSGGLDDFEKEAFEGFEELKSTGLSDQLIKDLDKRIDETYFKDSGSKPKWIWYSMAAGLLLVVGLSFYMVNDFTKEESSLALAKEEMKDQAEKLKDEISLESQTTQPPAAEAKEEAAKGITSDAATTTETTKPDQSAADLKNHLGQNGSGASGPTEALPRMVTKENQKEPAPATPLASNNPASASADISTYKQDPSASSKRDNKSAGDADAGYDDLKKTEEKPGDSRKSTEQDAKLTQAKPARAYEEAEKSVARNKKSSESPTGGLNEETSATSGNTINNAPAQTYAQGAKDKEQREEMANYESKTVHDEAKAKGTAVATGGAAGENSLRRSAYFKTASFNNHDEYFRKEIDKNTTLKAEFLKYNKAFRIDITINENGKVTDVKADLPLSCNECKLSLEKIILQMPNWQPAQSANGTYVKQSFYFNYKY